MSTLPHYAAPLPAYSTAMAFGRRVVQQTVTIAPDAADDAAARRAIDHRRELVEKLAEAGADLRNSIKEWDDIDDDNGDVSNDEKETAGDDLADKALYVVELLKELGY